MSEITRRNLLAMIGTAAGSTAMYHAMASMGFAAPSDYSGPIKLDGDPQGAKVLILGAGLAGLTAAYEMRAAGYEVEVLEFREKAGGRCWTLRSGDSYTELGGASQNVANRLRRVISDMEGPRGCEVCGAISIAAVAQ